MTNKRISHHHYSKHVFLLVLLSMNLMLVSGCVSTSFVEVRNQNSGFHFPFQKRLAEDEPQISEQTRQIIEKENLNTGFGFKRNKQISYLEIAYNNSPSTELAQSLAELHYVNGQKKELVNKKQAQDSYFKSAIYSYRFFFDENTAQMKEPSDDQIYHVRKIYNKSLEKYLRMVCKKKVPFLNHQFTVQDGNNKFTVTIDPEEWSWKPDELDHFEYVSDYKVNGIETIHKTTGLGVPLIAVRRANNTNPEIEKHYARGISFPITAFLHLDSSNDSSNTECRLVLYDPHQKRAVTIDDKEVTLETDLTTPLAYFMKNSQMKGIDHLGLIRPDKAQKVAGIYMLRPYQEDKIPVLMIHGLWSSPITWLEAYNDLQAIPEIDEKYQFWFYLYPSGKPFIQTAADLREDLKEVRLKFDPNEDNPELDNMVLVGHSMGGLIAKAVTVESGDKYWNAISRVPLDSIKANDANRNAIKRVLFFDSNPSINRIITVATPHRGSHFSNGPSRWLIRQLTTLPQQTLQISKSILLNNPKAFRKSEAFTGKTSTDSLSPDSAILKILRKSEYSDNINHHNIVGVLNSKKSAGSTSSLVGKTDGIVSFESAHVENAKSELIVQAGHSSVQKHKDTISEIHRILKLHAKETSQKSGVILIGGKENMNENESPILYQSHSFSDNDIRASRPARISETEKSPQIGIKF